MLHHKVPQLIPVLRTKVKERKPQITDLLVAKVRRLVLLALVELANVVTLGLVDDRQDAGNVLANNLTAGLTGTKHD